MSRRSNKARYDIRTYGYYALILILILAGCKDKDPYTPISDKEYKVGTDGLIYSFTPSGPPPKIFEKGVFDIASEIWNKGAYEIEEGYITANLENSYMCIIAQADEEAECITQTTEIDSVKFLGTEMQHTDIVVRMMMITYRA